MKLQIRIYLLLVICFFAVQVNAQQKASERSFASELSKINEKKRAHTTFTSQQSQTEIKAGNINTGISTVQPGIRKNPFSSVPGNVKPSSAPVTWPSGNTRVIPGAKCSEQPMIVPQIRSRVPG